MNERIKNLSKKAWLLAHEANDQAEEDEGEELTALLKLKAEEILIRWMNFHLVAAGQEKITNLGSDLKDSRKLIYVLN